MLRLGLFSLLAALSGANSQIQLIQSGTEIKKPGESVKVSCKTSGYTFTNYNIQWVRQPPGKGLEWIGEINPSNGGTSYAPSFQGRVTMSRDNSISTAWMQLGSLRADDTATYYCARPSDYWGQGTLVTVTSVCPKTPSVFPLTSCSPEANTTHVTFGCLVNGYFPEPVSVEWSPSIGSTGLKTYPSMKHTSGDLYSLSSQATVLASSWESNTYRCNVKHEPTSSTITKEIPNVLVFIVPPEPSELYMAGSPMLTCLVVNLPNNDPLKVEWTKEKLRSTDNTNPPMDLQRNHTFSANSTLSITKQEWEDGEKYSCKVKHSGMPSPIIKSISKYQGTSFAPSVYLLRPHPDEVKSNSNGDTVSLTCLVRGFYPKDISVKWMENNNSSDRNKSVTTSPMKEGEDGLTYFLYSKMTVDKASWNNMTTYSCMVIHEALKPMKFTKRNICHEDEADSEVTCLSLLPKEMILSGEFCTEDDDEELNSLWSTISVFITLFLLSVCYSATVTLFKVKWFFASMVQMKQARGPQYTNVFQRVV